MKARILTGIVVAAVLVAAAAPFALRAYRAHEVRQVVTRYDLLLAQGLSDLTPEIVGEVAGDEEVGRIGSYSTYLWGNNIKLESDLLELEVLEVRSEGATLTAIVRESWRHHERDRKSGLSLGEPWEETQKMEYTLLRKDGRLIVHRAKTLEAASEDR